MVLVAVAASSARLCSCRHRQQGRGSPSGLSLPTCPWRSAFRPVLGTQAHGRMGHRQLPGCCTHVLGKTIMRAASTDAEQQGSGSVCIPVVDSLTERGMQLLSCLLDEPDKFVGRVKEELEILADGLLDGDQDLPASTSRQQQLALAQDVIYCWMLAEAYKCTGNKTGCSALERDMRLTLRRTEEGLLAEGESRRQQLSDVVFMRHKRGMYKLGAVMYSRSVTENSPQREGLSISDKAREDWLAQQQKTLAVPRQQASVLFSTWARTGYLDRRLEDRAKLDQMVTGVAGSKSQYYQELTNDLIQQAEADTQMPSPMALDLLQIRSQEAFDAIEMHAKELLTLDPNRPVDEFANMTVTDFSAMQRMMEEACRCGRALYDAEQIVSQSFSLSERRGQP